MNRANRPHRHPRLRRAGVLVLVVGAAAFVLPVLPPAPFSSEMADATQALLWERFGATVLMFVGNLMRLVGEQGHPGLPWPLWGGIDHDALARWIVRKRLSFHRRHPHVTLRRRVLAQPR